MIGKSVRTLAMALALVLVALSFINASWLTTPPGGYIKLIAHRGTMQQLRHAALADRDCTAARIEPPFQPYLENTAPGLQQAVRLGAQMIEIDIAPTSDGRIALFHDDALDCRTDGHGLVRDHTLGELKKLDAGYGYTADGGRTFPLRGQGAGMIPSLEDALMAVPDTALLYNLKGRTPDEAARLIAALRQAGRDPVKRGDGFSAPDAELPAIRAAFPGVWAYSAASIAACTKAYLWQGWLGLTPAACRNATLVVPLNRQWAFAGWPNRLMARMQAAGARVMVIGSYGAGDRPIGLDLPEQIGDIPSDFTGYVWVDDIWTIGPALRPAYNKRTPPQEQALARALDARRRLRE